jgi:glutathione peroxidase
LFARADVNGANELPLFSYLKASQPIPSGPGGEFIMKSGGLGVIWAPLKRSDIAWNFEKFLVDGEGKLVKRYSAKYKTMDIKSDIEALLSNPSKKPRLA